MAANQDVGLVFFSVPVTSQHQSSCSRPTLLGVCGVSNSMLKHLPQEGLIELTDIANLSFQQGEVPRCWKMSEICPIPKVQAPKSLSDFRPVSLTSCLCKLTERLVLNRLESWPVTWPVTSVSAPDKQVSGEGTRPKIF
jgi:hypothetical protein